MRDYAIVSPHFWTGHTGRQIRKLGHEAQVIALYLMTAPGSNMIGLYYLPLPSLAHETGCPIEGASKGLTDLENLGFCRYDPESEVVWVCEMARWQIGEQIKEGDKRHGRVSKEVYSYANSPFYHAFMERYGASFRLVTTPSSKGHRRGIEGASKGHRRGPRVEQDQEQDIDQEQEQEQTPRGSAQRVRETPPPTPPEEKTGAPPPDPPVLVRGNASAPNRWKPPPPDDPEDEAACEAFGEALLAAWPAGHVNPVRFQRALLDAWRQGLIRADGTEPRAEKSRTAGQVLSDMPLWKAYHESGARPKHLETYLTERCFQVPVPRPLKTNGKPPAPPKEWNPGVNPQRLERARAKMFRREERQIEPPAGSGT